MTAAQRMITSVARPEIEPLSARPTERNVEEYPIEPICWTVNEFVLIHSMHGHVRLARWPLRA
jgi:hypothetical protein